MNFKTLAANLGLEEEEFLELMVLFAQTGADDLARLQAGLAEGNIDQVLRNAHTIKGASANLGLTEFSDLAHAIEQHATDHRLEAAARVLEDLKIRFESIQSIA